MTNDVLSNPEVSLTNCDREPIHIPGSIQPHGILIALDNDCNVVNASINLADELKEPLESILQQPIERVIGADAGTELRTALTNEEITVEPLYLMTVELRSGRRMHLLAHRHNDATIVEFEPTEPEQPANVAFRGVHGRVRSGIRRLEMAGSIEDLCHIVADEIRRLTGFGRVMVYQLDPNWHGQVVAESLDPQRGMQSYLEHYFPATDIPRQARELYRLNRIRLIGRIDYQPCPIQPPNASGTNQPLDLSYSALRSVSPIHLEYLHNMNVGASMSISVMKEGELWGLIACHHDESRFISYDVRSACDFLTQVFSIQLSAQSLAVDTRQRLDLAAIHNQLLAAMAGHENFLEALVEHGNELLKLGNANGAAICTSGSLHLIGQTPNEAEIKQLIDWLDRGESVGVVYETDALTSVYPQAESFENQPAGVLAIGMPRFGKNCLIWFRPEVIRSIKWAGDPEKQPEPAPGDGRIHPRRSFRTWMQTVHRRSRPWQKSEIEAVSTLRDAIIAIILTKAEELTRLNSELSESNRELEAFSYSVSHDLRAPFRHIAGFTDLLRRRSAEQLDATGVHYLNTIADAARYAGTLVDSLLAFSQMSRRKLAQDKIDLNQLFGEVRLENEQLDGVGRKIQWSIGKLPEVRADPMMLRLVVRNLLSNAIKFTRPRDVAEITVGAIDDPDEVIVFVRDNGVGFDMTYIDKLFGVFQRFHTVEEFEGTGIGLANVKRIIERHGGRVWAESKVDEGSTFFFSLPKTSGSKSE